MNSRKVWMMASNLNPIEAVRDEWESSEPTGCWLDGEHNLHLAGSAGNPQRYFVLMAVEHEIKTCGSDREISNLDLLKERWQHGTDEAHQTMRCIDS